MTDDEAARRLGLRVRVLRKARGWTQAELSRQTYAEGRGWGINRPNITRLENGRYGSIPMTSTVLRLARALEMQPSEIFGALDDPPSSVPSSTHAAEEGREPEDDREEHRD